MTRPALRLARGVALGVLATALTAADKPKGPWAEEPIV